MARFSMRLLAPPTVERMCGVSVVNGYLCYSSCQAAAARAGKDPHAPPGAPSDQGDQKDKANGLVGQSPAILDPGHEDLASAVSPADAAGAANGDYRAAQGVNLLV
jgi:hypothetical protein